MVGQGNYGKNALDRTDLKQENKTIIYYMVMVGIVIVLLNVSFIISMALEQLKILTMFSL